MRKQIFGRKFKRDTNERKALFRSLMNGLVLNGSIKTTEAKAKAIKGDVEKLVTMGKNKGESSRRILTARLANEKVADKILAEIAPKFATRPGGYTKILRLGNRVKDNAPYVMLTWVEQISVTPVTEPKRNTLKPTKTSSPKAEVKEKKEVKPAKKTAKKETK
ncbi:MAG TPA: 50S ribosomal protein L17 [Patescibacteria group bacterium]|nr:50S ribosomal protein L17 [Patescibacteria group bacterium]